jgi:hypothetical protein
MNLYAISNGASYSDHRVYVFSTDDSRTSHAVIEAIVFETNKGRRDPFEILAGAEVLEELIKPDADAFAVFLDDLSWSCGFDEDGNTRDVLARWPHLKTLVNNYRAKQRVKP